MQYGVVKPREMSKRFTETDKWEDEWFSNLTREWKLIWLYLCDRCTRAGRWKKDFKTLNFMCDTKINESQFREVFQGRAFDMGSFYFIPKFLKIQYPNGLDSKKLAFVAVRREIKDYKLEQTIHEVLGIDYLSSEAMEEGGKSARRLLTYGECPPHLVLAFEFCLTPSIVSKRAALEDLHRRGVSWADMESVAQNYEYRSYSFWDIIRMMEGKFAKKIPKLTVHTDTITKI